MPVKHQNALFEHFTNTLEAIVLEEKKLGKFDLGILGKFQMEKFVPYSDERIIFSKLKLSI